MAHSETDAPQPAGRSYRAYRIDDRGRISAATPLDAETDDEAVQQARALLDGQTLEIWERGRFVAAVSPERK